MIRPEASPYRISTAEESLDPFSDPVETVTAEPRLAFPRRFHLGQLIATPEAVAAAHAAGINVVTVVLRHLAGDWGDVDPATSQHNDTAVATGGCLHSVYRLSGDDDALVVTTDADRGRTVAALASQRRQSIQPGGWLRS
jgi:hypothetical protein